ncbi:MAG: hypothetical protein GY943_21950 [Chloroflexi bacterium]|nr:hypothetical protein [Chloroflexota bacterium]
MKRIHLFEFEDLPWFPHLIREAMTDYLQFVADKFDIYKPIIHNLKKGLKQSNTQRIIDIGSGSGGGIVNIYNHLQAEFAELEITLTDLYPNLSAFQAIAAQTNGKINYWELPVDATDVPADLNGFRLQLLSFHHFKPEMAQRILQNAAENRAAIGILEAHERKWPYIITMLFSPLMVLLFTPFIKPFKLSRLVFTYLIPVIPLFVLWDGLVSILRTYTVAELRQMTDQIDPEDYTWEIGRLPENGAAGVSYLLGYPHS